MDNLDAEWSVTNLKKSDKESSRRTGYSQSPPDAVAPVHRLPHKQTSGEKKSSKQEKGNHLEEEHKARDEMRDEMRDEILDKLKKPPGGGAQSGEAVNDVDAKAGVGMETEKLSDEVQLVEGESDVGLMEAWVYVWKDELSMLESDIWK